LTLTIDNMGRQVSDYLDAQIPDPNALYILWAGGNDLLDDRSADNVDATANQVGALVSRLALAGARYFLVPNVPPLGAVPSHASEAEKAASLDRAAATYRAKLEAALDATVLSLAGQGILVQIYRLDVWRLFLDLINEPATFGFTNVQEGAQNKSVNCDKYLFWDELHPTTAGHYQIAAAAYQLLSASAIRATDPLNISTRANIGVADDVLIGGLLVTGDSPKRVVVRGIGPSLSVNGKALPGRLDDPVLQLFKGSTLIASNNDWRDTQQFEIAAIGLAPRNDLEAAIVRTLDPGNYTAVLKGAHSGTGIGLVEAYDVDGTSAAKLANTSTRGVVGTGDDVLIGGFIIAAGGKGTIVVRAIGPSLGGSGVTNALANPTLDLRDANGNLVAANDDWNNTQPAVIKATTLQPADDREAAVFEALLPGNYTAIVRGKDETTGVGLVEVYNLR
jgi:lysophospholipase L1-like esterase